ncbi:hypothetical protein [Homoserinibacter sp. GY 40078]|uniref:hypothetical protein n=1 Tax=Homoserinibacter sp. GY 40078 TaxID=2603275 RepID=UPI0011CB14D4|nr:hypothetical protein [Homoserinibacter sp. GY 40078]TXK18537.1 hypothetical protein FVQ89_00845 [Homoserinibacter sp. GY 40078]
MATLEQHLTFDGDCETAIETYVAAFDANILTLLRYRDAQALHPARLADHIARAELEVFGARLVLGDSPGAHPRGAEATTGIVLLLPEPARRQAVAVLAEEHGRVLVAEPRTDHTATLEVIDAFGVLWHLGVRGLQAA